VIADATRPAVVDPRPMRAAHPIDDALEAISRRYDDATARFVALQLEYAWRPAINDKPANAP
jgi:hypothetical protein